MGEEDSGRSPVPGSGCQPTASAVPASRSGIPNAWQAMDDWCREQSKKLLAQTNPHILKGSDLNDREFRRLLGQSQAFLRMRSFIHGSRNAQGIEAGTATTEGRSPKDESPVA